MDNRKMRTKREGGVGQGLYFVRDRDCLRVKHIDISCNLRH